MTSPNFPADPDRPDKAWTAQTVWQTQHVDPDQYALNDNAQVHGHAELVRQTFYSSIYTAVEQIPIIGGLIGDIIEIFTGVEDGDLNDLGTWVSNLGSFINNFIAAALHALADLLDFIPIIGPGLSDIIDAIATGMNGTHQTATTALADAATAQETATTAIGTAETAVSTASAAANDAANAVEKADIAYEAATEWQLEFVAASAEVGEGTNELLLGPVLNVRDGRTAILTDIHVALLEQHGGMTVDTRKWNATGTTYTVAHTGVIDPLVTRRNFTALTVEVKDKERFFPYVTDIVGSIPPTVLQIAVAGVFIDAPTP
ncbi:hypothetical protein [Nocardia farcinica]